MRAEAGPVYGDGGTGDREAGGGGGGGGFFIFPPPPPVPATVKECTGDGHDSHNEERRGSGVEGGFWDCKVILMISFISETMKNGHPGKRRKT
jgi:hypothetical protein